MTRSKNPWYPDRENPTETQHKPDAAPVPNNIQYQRDLARMGPDRGREDERDLKGGERPGVPSRIKAALERIRGSRGTEEGQASEEE